jgi:hypothetical protein
VKPAKAFHVPLPPPFHRPTPPSSPEPQSPMDQEKPVVQDVIKSGDQPQVERASTLDHRRVEEVYVLM